MCATNSILKCQRQNVAHSPPDVMHISPTTKFLSTIPGRHKTKLLGRREFRLFTTFFDKVSNNLHYIQKLA